MTSTFGITDTALGAAASLPAVDLAGKTGFTCENAEAEAFYETVRGIYLEHCDTHNQIVDMSSDDAANPAAVESIRHSIWTEVQGLTQEQEFAIITGTNGYNAMWHTSKFEGESAPLRTIISRLIFDMGMEVVQVLSRHALHCC